MEIKKRAPMISYSEAFKRNVIDEYLVSGLPKLHVQRKHGVKFKSAIITWMKQLGYEDGYQKVSIFRLSNQLELANKFNPGQLPSKDAKALEKRIKELERQLEDEKIRTEMLSRMIDVAETEFKVPIRKKPNTK
jgi:transposase-like protein